MKKFISVLFALILMSALCVPAFAYTLSDLGCSGVSISNGDLHISTLKTSLLTEEQKQFMRNWLKSPSGYVSIDKSSGRLFFGILEGNFTNVKFTGNGKMIQINNYPSDSCYAKTIAFNLNNFEPVDSKIYSFMACNVNLGYLIGSSFLANHPEAKDKITDDAILQGFTGNFYVTDDDGLLDDSSGESSSSNSSGGTEIVIPKTDNEYVPYDTTIWNGFLGSVKNSIGSSTNIGLLIFAVIMSILIVIAVVRKFART